MRGVGTFRSGPDFIVLADEEDVLYRLEATNPRDHAQIQRCLDVCQHHVRTETRHRRAERAPAFEDVCHYWEVMALLDAYIVAYHRPHIVPRPRLESSCFVGRAIARELGISAFVPGTRGRTRSWTGPGANAVELDIPGFKQGTDVVSDSAEGVVLAAAQAIDAGGAVRITSPEPLGADLLRELPVYSGRERPFPASHVHTWGKYSSYEDDRYRRRHRASWSSVVAALGPSGMRLDSSQER